MRIVFCGGGTGGHLFTGIAMADNPGGVHFLCTPRRFDAEQLSACGLPSRYRRILWFGSRD